MSTTLATLQNLRTFTFDNHPTDLEEGQLAFNMAEQNIDLSKNDANIYMYVGNGSSDRLDEDGTELVTGGTDGKGWVRYRLRNFGTGGGDIYGDVTIIDGKLKVTRDSATAEFVLPLQTVTPTSGTEVGSLRWNTTLSQLQVWNGTAWDSSNLVFVGSSAPTPASQGDLWYDTDNSSGNSSPTLKVYDSTWKSVGRVTLGTTDVEVGGSAVTTVSGLSSLSATSLTGTLQTASQPNVTGVGTLTSGVWNATAIGVAYGGTGLTATPSNGQIPIGNGAGYTLATITGGTALTTTNGAGSITIDLDNTAVTPAGYGAADTVSTFTVDQQGRLTAAADVTISIVHTQVSDFDTGVQSNRLDQMAAPTSDVSFNNVKITSLSDPTSAQDAATKNYVDGSVVVPGGSDTQIQYNSSGSFAGSSNLAFDGTTVSTTGLNVTGTSAFRAAATQDGVKIVGRAGGTGDYDVTITPTTLSADRTLTLANGDTTLQAGTMAITGGKLSQFAATTSAELAGVISNETGTGALVFGTSPTITTSLTVNGNTTFGRSASATDSHQFFSRANWNFSEVRIIRNASNTATPKMLSFQLDGDSSSDTNLYNYYNLVLATSGSPTSGSTSVGLSASLSLYGPNDLRVLLNGSERLRVTRGGSVKIGGTANRATTEGTNALVLFNGTAPVGTLTNGVSFYSTAGEARVMDAAGNATLLSPHDKETNEWIYDSVDTRTGKRLRIRMEALMRFLNEHFDLDFVEEFTEEVPA